MERPTEGCCGTCGWLAKSVRAGGSAPRPIYAVYDEAEEYYREHPNDGLTFVPVGYPTAVQCELTCFVRAANLFQEARHQGEGSGSPGEPAWLAVIWRDRHCPRWSRWQLGVPPRDQVALENQRHLEEDRRQFQLQLNAFSQQQQEHQRHADRRLALAAVTLAVIIGVVQLTAAILAMTPDAVGCQLVKNLVGWTGALSWLTCK